jgi:sigma-B regulation protein RsbU (phosphoserine phosphatase)
VRFASAGHPSPFRAQRENRTVKPLFERLQGNPALGLLPEATYQQWTQPIKAGDVFVLFTDGVHEAYNDQGEEFGLERVQKTIHEQLRNKDSDLPTAIVTELLRFIAPAQPADDICIVALEVKATPLAEQVTSGQIAETKKTS